MIPNGTEIIAAEKSARLKQMALALQYALMNQDGLGPEMRAEALKRIERWLEESDEACHE